MRRMLAPLAAIVLIAGCDRDPTRPRPVAESEPQTVAFLVMSDTAPVAGDDVRVTARARAAAGIGSFTARLRFDATRLAYVGSESASGMRAVNEREPGLLIVAGADPSGFTEDALFTVRFRAITGGSADALQLEISELTGTNFESLMPSLAVRGTVGAERGSR